MMSSSSSSNVVATAAVGSSSQGGGGGGAATNDVTFKADVVVSPNPSTIPAGAFKSNVTLFGDGIGNTIITGRRNNVDGSKTTNTITADGRAVPDDINGGGICIHRCQILATPELLKAMAEEEAAGRSIESYLGRPWKKYSRTVIMNTNMEGFLNHAGWTEWPGAPDDTYDTVYYAEYQNSGDGAATDGRVAWKGYIREGFDPSKFTVAAFIDGNSWLPKTGVPFTPGLQDDDEPAAPAHPF
ncbi:hypothetical protein DM860_011037 [Cuscuta australis]|uniref:Pectinesterase catalytic domain-containing protein n=1 Tax=Cuscuta australis TaxID=267555 RepID=A0A328E0M2_9ASTE|nr:hypothetical protein DM860_011037 [Cuscuta australis]